MRARHGQGRRRRGLLYGVPRRVENGVPATCAGRHAGGRDVCRLDGGTTRPMRLLHAERGTLTALNAPDWAPAVLIPIAVVLAGSLGPRRWPPEQ